MSDNTTLNTGSGGDTLRTEDRTTFKTPVSLIDVGGSSGEALIGDGTNSLPVRGLGSAGSPATGVVTIQGIGSGTAVPVSIATVPSHAVTNAGVFAVQVDGSALTSLQLLDDVIYADDASWSNDSSKHALIGGLYQSSPQTITDGKVGPIQLTTNGYQIVSVANTLTVSSHPVTNAGTFAVQESGAALTSLQLLDDVVYAEDLASSNGDKGVLILGVRRDTAASSSTTDGDYSTLNLDSTGKLHVNVGNTVTVGSHAVTNAGTFAVQVDGASLTSLQLIDDIVQVALPSSTKSAVVSGIYKTTPYSLGDGETGVIALTTNGYVQTRIESVNGTLTVSDTAAEASLSIIDDWDESDRCKVNPISGQAGVAGGSGSVSSSTQRVCLATDVALPAGTNLLGRTSASPETSTLYDGTTALTPKFAKISCSSSGENTLVALVSAKKIRVLSLSLIAVGTAVSIYFKDAASGTAIYADSTNPVPLDKSGAAGAAGFNLGYNPLGWFQSASGGALILNLSTAQAVAGSLSYVEV